MPFQVRRSVPLPEKALALLAPRSSLPSLLAPMKGKAEMPAEVSELLGEPDQPFETYSEHL